MVPFTCFYVLGFTKQGDNTQGNNAKHKVTTQQGNNAKPVIVKLAYLINKQDAKYNNG